MMKNRAWLGIFPQKFAKNSTMKVFSEFIRQGVKTRGGGVHTKFQTLFYL